MESRSTRERAGRVDCGVPYIMIRTLWVIVALYWSCVVLMAGAARPSVQGPQQEEEAGGLSMEFCMETNVKVAQRVAERQAGEPNRFEVEVSTDCSCGGAKSVALWCSGLKADMLVAADQARLHIDEAHGLCFLLDQAPITPSSPFSFQYYTSATPIGPFRITVASATFPSCPS